MSRFTSLLDHIYCWVDRRIYGLHFAKYGYGFEDCVGKKSFEAIFKNRPILNKILITSYRHDKFNDVLVFECKFPSPLANPKNPEADPWTVEWYRKTLPVSSHDTYFEATFPMSAIKNPSNLVSQASNF